MLMEREELELSSRWGWVVARGVVAILFGLLAFSQPGTIGLTLVLMFAAYAFISGIAAVVSAAKGGREGAPRWGTLLFEGLLYIAAGIVAVLWPAAAGLAFLWVLAVWAIVGGAMEIASALRLRRVMEHEWALGLAGLLSVAFGVLVLFRPLVGGLAIVFWLGAYAIIFGVLQMVVGFRLRSYAHAHRGGDLPSAGLRQPT
ncbi:MAG TPA: HdeD family acid-resistance protein [Polyangia bacterium]|jgi:uncharacterized membrane protein HdeD (DUF308 family)|nr:HdeD family acid-resistance protein [Polyangia bacterium]